MRAHAPAWLLPGAQALAPHSVIALQTNPEFIDAYLVGLNTQFLAEARWRGLQVDRWGTPLRMFFGPAAATGERLADIVPIDNWPDDSALGAPSHQMPAPGAPQDGDASAERLVILFNSPLFRRYPATLVYLQRLMGDADIDDLILIDGPRDLAPPTDGTPQEVEHWYRTRTFIAPAFTGTLGPELTFFVFDVQPTDLDDFNLILEEPELELRFRNDQGVLLDSSAAQAARIADTHTRVAMSGRYLKEQGLGSAPLGVKDEGAHQ